MRFANLTCISRIRCFFLRIRYYFWLKLIISFDELGVRFAKCTVIYQASSWC